MISVDPSEVSLAKSWASRYVSLGFNPIPARPIPGKNGVPRIRPSMKSFTDVREGGIGTSILDRWWAPCVQVSLGVKPGIAVVDLDDARAVEVWRLWTMHRPPIRTWAVRHDARGGMHLWFVTMPGLVLPFATRVWEMDGEKHTAIEVLGDRNLIVAPPSISPRTGNRYAFLPGCGPDDMEAPAIMPEWLVSAVSEASDRDRTRRLAKILSRRAPRQEPEIQAPLSHKRGACGYYDKNSVIAAITDMISLGRSLGLRIAKEGGNDAGWVECHSIYREDNDPSAMFSVETGNYWEESMGRLPLTLFDLMIFRGKARDFGDAIRQLGSIYIGDQRRARKPEDQSKA